MIQTFSYRGVKYSILYHLSRLVITIINLHFVSRLPSFSVEVSTSIPIGAGLGSSASYCVCLSTALLAASGRITLPSLRAAPGSVLPSTGVSATEGETRVSLSAQDLKLICNWSLEAEKLVHRKPSGIDNSVCTYGECMF